MMTTLKIGRSLKDDDVLWRYLSLDKFISMLESRGLHFSPLYAFRQSDPFEGFVPKVMMEFMAAGAKRAQKKFYADIEARKDLFNNLELAELRSKVANLSVISRETHKTIISCTMVNCWHRSAYESEAMWKLYAQAGVAIRTTVGAIQAALEVSEQQLATHIGSIKYLDFSNPSLSEKDCLSDDGHAIGMIKRVAYAHENEVRMFIARAMPKGASTAIQPSSTTVDVNIEKLIKGIVISPLANESLKQSIYAVTRSYGIEQSLVSISPLLDKGEYLLDAYSNHLMG